MHKKYLLTPEEVKQKMDAGENFVFLDVRTLAENRDVSIADTTLIPLDILEEESSRLPRNKEIIVFCKSGGRAMEAARILMDQGFRHVSVMEGGISHWPYETNRGGH